MKYPVIVHRRAVYGGAVAIVLWIGAVLTLSGNALAGAAAVIGLWFLASANWWVKL